MKIARLLLAACAAVWLARPPTASAFCGFYVSGSDGALYNKATLVVMMRDGTRTVLSMQNEYEGPPENFAIVIPVPVVLQRENVKTLPKEIFRRVDSLAAPRLVEYWEQDPCAPEAMEDRAVATPMGVASSRRGRSGGGDLGVRIEAQFTVGEYEIVILSARDSSGLDTWLRRERYNIPQGAEPVLRPYVQAGTKFFVARVDATKVRFENGHVMLSPLRFHYDSEEFSLPVRLGLLNSSGTQDLIVHILARNQRYEVANYRNVTIPTNIDVADSTRSSFGAFYAALFDRTVERNQGAVVTEYSWDAGSCDPCPTPALTPQELATLGADALPGAAPPVAPGGRGGRSRFMFMGGGFVLTRLHFRYGKDGLGQDLTFRAAPPIVGGREFVRTAGGGLEEGAQPGPVNNFQARYAMRHPWAGPIACASPRRGRWGGPPNGAQPPPAPALDLASAPRGAVQLASIVKQNIPEIGVISTSPATPLVQASPPSPLPVQPPAAPPTPATRTGCGACIVAARSRTAVAPAAVLGALLVAAMIVRRRARRTTRSRTQSTS